VLIAANVWPLPALFRLLNAVMAVFAQALQFTIPEQVRTAPVRYYVIGHRGWHYLPFPQAIPA
jgi:hypothetical protein